MQPKFNVKAYESHLQVYGEYGRLRAVYYVGDDETAKIIRNFTKAVMPYAKIRYERKKKRVVITYSGERKDVESKLASLAIQLAQIYYATLQPEPVEAVPVEKPNTVYL